MSQAYEGLQNFRLEHPVKCRALQGEDMDKNNNVRALALILCVKEAVSKVKNAV